MEEGGRSSLSFLNRQKVPWFWGEKCPACVHLLFKFSFEMQFQEHPGEQIRNFFPAKPFFHISYAKCLSKCPYSKKPVLRRKNPASLPVTLILSFHSNFHLGFCKFKFTKINFAKLTHDNISLNEIWNCLYLQIFPLETLVSVTLKKVKIIFVHNYLRCCKYSSNISDYIITVEITPTQQYTRLAKNRFLE